MQRLVLVLLLASGPLGPLVTAVQSRPDLSGTWAGPTGSLTIQQNEATLTVSEGADVRTFNLDGSESRFAKGDSQYTARTRWVGSALVVSITTTGPIGTWEDLEVYSLDYGPTLTVVHVGTQTRRPMMFTQTRTYESVARQQDTTVVLGEVERDVTGDGRVDVLRVVGRGPTIDNLDAEFTIESAGTTAYRFQLHTLSRSVGFDAGRRTISRGRASAPAQGFRPVVLRRAEVPATG